MIIEKHLLAKWQSKGGKWFIELFAEMYDDLLPGFSYRGNDCGGFIGTVAPEVAMQHAAQQASYCPSKMSRVFYDDAIAEFCCILWQREKETV